MLNVMRALSTLSIICWLQLASEADKLQSHGITMTGCYYNFPKWAEFSTSKYRELSSVCDNLRRAHVSSCRSCQLLTLLVKA